jgi:hypothetical protein
MTDPANTPARTLALLALAAGALGGLLAIPWLTSWRAELQSTGGPEAIRQLLMAISVCGTFAIGWYVFRLGQRVCREGRFPPAGARLIRATVVHTGADALRRGRWAQLAGVVFTVMALGLTVVGGRAMALLGRY